MSVLPIDKKIHKSILSYMQKNEAGHNTTDYNSIQEHVRQDMYQELHEEHGYYRMNAKWKEVRTPEYWCLGHSTFYLPFRQLINAGIIGRAIIQGRDVYYLVEDRKADPAFEMQFNYIQEEHVFGDDLYTNEKGYFEQFLNIREEVQKLS